MKLSKAIPSREIAEGGVSGISVICGTLKIGNETLDALLVNACTVTISAGARLHLDLRPESAQLGDALAPCGAVEGGATV